MKGGDRMDKLTIVVSIIGVIGTLSSIFFAYLAFKKNMLDDHRTDGKAEGIMFSDIGYIKACVDRVEKNLNKVDERYRDMLQRLSKAEEAILNVTKRVDEILKMDGG